MSRGQSDEEVSEMREKRREARIDLSIKVGYKVPERRWVEDKILRYVSRRFA